MCDAAADERVHSSVLLCCCVCCVVRMTARIHISLNHQPASHWPSTREESPGRRFFARLAVGFETAQKRNRILRSHLSEKIGFWRQRRGTSRGRAWDMRDISARTFGGVASAQTALGIERSTSHPRSRFLISGPRNFILTKPRGSLRLVDLSRIPSGTFFREVHPGSEMARQNHKKMDVA